jgi:hypothetical protein
MLLPSFSLISPAQDFLYIPIDKNASSRIKDELFSNKWQLAEDMDLGIGDSFDSNALFKFARKFAVLRDPYERWLTGFTTFVSYRDARFFNLPLYDLLKSKHWYITLQILFEYHNDFEFDWHTKPQYKYLDVPDDLNVDIDSIDFFLYDTSIMLKLNTWFKNLGIEGLFDNNYYQNKRSESNLIYNNLIHYLNENSHHKEKLMSWLMTDYKFFNSVKFVV